MEWDFRSGLNREGSTYSAQAKLAKPRSVRRAKIEKIECAFLKRRAELIREDAQVLHFAGKTASAIPIYSKSIRLHPTALAHAYLGWAYSSHGRYDLAIRECMKAIELDPELGNPYNDIGSYLVSQGKLEEAIEWFEKAKQAKRYESPHFPYMNLGRLYSSRGRTFRAIQEFKKALELKPGEESCLKALNELRKRLA